jgi:hypothetical protein
LSWKSPTDGPQHGNFSLVIKNYSHIFHNNGATIRSMYSASVRL